MYVCVFMKSNALTQDKTTWEVYLKVVCPEKDSCCKLLICDVALIKAVFVHVTETEIQSVVETIKNF